MCTNCWEGGEDFLVSSDNIEIRQQNHLWKEISFFAIFAVGDVFQYDFGHLVFDGIETEEIAKQIIEYIKQTEILFV